MSITSIPTQHMQLHQTMQELVESICRADCSHLKGCRVANPYHVSEPEYRWYRRYAWKHFQVTAI